MRFWLAVCLPVVCLGCASRAERVPVAIPSPDVATTSPANGQSSEEGREAPGPGDGQAPQGVLIERTSNPVTPANFSDRSDQLPSTLPDLLVLLEQLRGEVDTLIEAGRIGAVYVPALQAKDVALATEAHAEDLSGPARLHVLAAVKRIVLKAWQLDAYGDLGDATQVAEAQAEFVAAIQDLHHAFDAH